MRSTLFKIFGIPIRAYGLMMVIGFVLGVSRAARVAKRRGIAPERMWDLGLVVLVSGVVGARLVYVLLNPPPMLRGCGLPRSIGGWVESLREFLAVWNGGLSFHGGVAFAVLFGWLYVRRVGIGFWVAADLSAPSGAIGYAVTRIGCFLNGCCYGAPTNLPWAVRFNDHGFITPPSHPTQIYAALANLLIFCILTRLEKVRRAPGFVFISYLGLYSVYRFAIEFLRKGYSAQVSLLGLTQAQWASAVIGVACAVAIAARYRRAPNRESAPFDPSAGSGLRMRRKPERAG